MDTLHHLPPTEQVYHSFVPVQYDGLLIEQYFAARFNYLDEEQWRRHIQEGMITLNGNPAEPGIRVKAQDQTVTRMGLRAEPPANRKLEVVYEDRRMRIFNKAAPIPVHPCGRYFKNSMTELLKDIYPDEVPRPVQRLDASTTGLIIFARTRPTAAFLMAEFKANRVYKEYLALVEGIPGQKKFIIDSTIGRIKGSKRGTGEDLVRPQSARTDCEWLATLGHLSLLRALPRSGRTNQIRVHLSSIGLPLVNDTVYGNGQESLKQCGLHAWRLRFRCFENAFDITASPPESFKPFLDAAKIPL